MQKKKEKLLDNVVVSLTHRTDSVRVVNESFIQNRKIQTSFANHRLDSKNFADESDVFNICIRYQTNNVYYI